MAEKITNFMNFMVVKYYHKSQFLKSKVHDLILGLSFQSSFTDVMTAKLSFLYINFPERLLINQAVSHWGGKLRVN